MRKLLKEPLLHFLLLGALLFAVAAWRRAEQPVADSAGVIAVTEAVVARLTTGYERQFHQAPDREALRDLVAGHIREEVLYREALALGLDRDDTIVRRRLAQKMEFLTEDLLAAGEPDEAVLGRFFATNSARYARPARVTFRHVYFSPERRGAEAASASAREALTALGKGASDETLGDPFLHGFEFADRDPEELAALFGREFAQRLGRERTGEWLGPIASSYGLHLVRVSHRTEPRPVRLDEVRATVVKDFNDERRRTANLEFFERLRRRYQVTVDEAALTNALIPGIRTAQTAR